MCLLSCLGSTYAAASLFACLHTIEAVEKASDSTCASLLWHHIPAGCAEVPACCIGHIPPVACHAVSHHTTASLCVKSCRKGKDQLSFMLCFCCRGASVEGLGILPARDSCIRSRDALPDCDSQLPLDSGRTASQPKSMPPMTAASSPPDPS